MRVRHEQRFSVKEPENFVLTRLAGITQGTINAAIAGNDNFDATIVGRIEELFCFFSVASESNYTLSHRSAGRGCIEYR